MSTRMKGAIVIAAIAIMIAQGMGAVAHANKGVMLLQQHHAAQLAPATSAGQE